MRQENKPRRSNQLPECHVIVRPADKGQVEKSFGQFLACRLAMGKALSLNHIQITPLLSRIERKINERFFRHLPDMSDLPHVISAKIWGYVGVVAYDEHFRSVSDILEYKTPQEMVDESRKSGTNQ